MTATDPAQPTEDGENRIDVIATAIRKAYGDDSALVARRQIEAASGDARADWIAILERLQA